MLVRLLYVSKPVGPITTFVTTSILEASSRNNKKTDITGVLCQGSGLYLQVIEGQRSDISALLSQIMADTRHKNVVIISMEEIEQRRYGQWSMALVQLSMDDPMVQMAHPEFDPYAASGSDVIKILDDLLKSSTPIHVMNP